MKFHVAAEPYAEVRDDVVEALSATRASKISYARIDWLYQHNPDGEAVVWTVRPDSDGSPLAGFTVALPRRMIVDGQSMRCWNCADFSIHPRYRSLGVALKLRRAAKEGVDEGQVDFLYAHPNERMQVIHEQVGHKPVGAMVRYAKVLGSRSWLNQRLRSKALAALAARPLDFLLRLRDSGRGGRPTSRVDVQPAAHFDDRFDALFEQAQKTRRIIGVRDARYLTWRYQANPLYKSHLVTAERDERLEGYVVFSVEDGVANVSDLFTSGDEAISGDLVKGLIRHCRGLGLQRVSMVALEGNPTFDVMQRFGFVRRPGESMMFCHAREDSSIREILLRHKEWYLTVGDRDV